MLDTALALARRSQKGTPQPAQLSCSHALDSVSVTELGDADVDDDDAADDDDADDDDDDEAADGKALARCW